MPSGLFNFSSLNWSISSTRDVWLVLSVVCFIKKSLVNANSVDPDQMSHFAESDLGLHCLPMFLLWDARHKCVNVHIRLTFSMLNENLKVRSYNVSILKGMVVKAGKY